MLFADIRTEWRVNDIEKSLHNKADSYQLESLRRDVDNLEHSLRENRSVCDGLRSELETLREELRRFREEIIPEVN
jgi:septal ring factor EnvC (AmiA/AmiB activator)